MLPRYHPHSEPQLHAFSAVTGGARRGLAGAHGRTKRGFTAGRSQPVTPFSAAVSISLFSRSSLLSRKVISHPVGNGKNKIDEYPPAAYNNLPPGCAYRAGNTARSERDIPCTTGLCMTRAGPVHVTIPDHVRHPLPWRYEVLALKYAPRIAHGSGRVNIGSTIYGSPALAYLIHGRYDSLGRG